MPFDGEKFAHLMKSDLGIPARNDFSDRFAGFDGDRFRFDLIVDAEFLQHARRV